jgi:hypothetical protein
LSKTNNNGISLASEADYVLLEIKMQWVQPDYWRWFQRTSKGHQFEFLSQAI